MNGRTVVAVALAAIGFAGILVGGSGATGEPSSVSLSAVSETDDSWCSLSIEAEPAAGERVVVEERHPYGGASQTRSFTESVTTSTSLMRGSNVTAYAVDLDDGTATTLAAYRVTETCDLGGRP